MTPTKETITKENIEGLTASPPTVGNKGNDDLVWIVTALQKLATEFIRFKDQVGKRYKGNYYKLAGQLIKNRGCASYVVFTCGRLYQKFKGTDTLTDPLAYLHEMLKPEKAVYDYGDGITWNEQGTTEEYYQTFFAESASPSYP